MIRWRRLVVVLLALLALPSARAHEVRPAYLELKETEPGRFSVLWRTPVLAGQRLPVALKLPAEARNLQEPSVQVLTDSMVERRAIDAGPGRLAGARIEFPGLQLTITDVLVRIERLDGTTATELVRPQRPYYDFEAQRGSLATAGVYLTQGVEHILLGVDHLLFVLGLLMIASTPWMLVKTITAFTVAHSITLGLATLSIVNVPGAPLEAAIALSILFVAVEMVRAWRGQTSFTLRHVWVIAFVFGLLHGFGFASGLTLIGLPRADVPLALLMFNVGVEIGQLAFVALVLLLVRALKVLNVRWPRGAELAPAYIVGSLGASWTLQRVVLMAG